MQQVDIDAAVIQGLTLGDIEDAEELGGVPFGQIANGGEVNMRALRALLFVVKRQSNPDYTFEDTRAVTLAQVAETLGPKAAKPGKLAKLRPSD